MNLYKAPAISVLILMVCLSSFAQHSPEQVWQGKAGQTLNESTPYKIEYNKKAPVGSPNVVWVLIDDAGFGATTAFGGLVETPNIEKLANQGCAFPIFIQPLFVLPRGPLC